MVFYFTTKGGYMVYMGKDKYENEQLIAHGWPEDVWFHVDDMSSAHVYLRTKDGESWEDIPEVDLMDCCQLVKANSIKGCKLASVKVVYTPWSNLRKTPDMVTGQIGFTSEKLRRYVDVAKDRDALKRLGKTKEERDPDLEGERKRRDDEERRRKKAKTRELRKAEQQAAEERRKRAEERSYDRLFEGAGGAGGHADARATEDDTAALEFEDDFM